MTALEEYLRAARRGGSGGAYPFGKGSLKYTLMTIQDLQAARILPPGTDRILLEEIRRHPEIPLDRTWDFLDLLVGPETAETLRKHAESRRKFLRVVRKRGHPAVGYTFSPYNLMAVAFRRGCALYVGVSTRGGVIKAARETGRASQIIDRIWDSIPQAIPEMKWNRPYPDLVVGSWQDSSCQDPLSVGRRVLLCCLQTLENGSAG